MKNLFIVMVIMAITKTTLACDGCSMYEYTAINNKSYVSFFYRHRVFNGYDEYGHRHKMTGLINGRVQHGSGEDGEYQILESEKDYMINRTLELRFNYTLRDQFNLTAILPYRRTEMYYDRVMHMADLDIEDSLSVIEGVGDLIFAFDWFKVAQGETWKHIFRPGVAVRIPTGRFNTESVHGTRYAAEMQPGTGALHLIPRLNYILLYKGVFGFNASASYSLSGQNKSNYRIGSMFNATVNLMYIQSLSDEFKLVPRLGLYYEDGGHDKVHEHDVVATGGTTLFMNSGLDVKFRKWTLQLLWQLPIKEHLHQKQIGNAGQVIAGLVYNLN